MPGKGDAGRALRESDMSSSDETTIRGAIEEWRRAICAKDVDAVMRHYTDDLRSFDIAPPLQSRGTGQARSGLEMWFRSWREVSIDMRDLELQVGDGVAYSASVNNLKGIRADNGEAVDMWLRATVGWRKTDGKWLVAHEHVSVPLRMDGSNRAAVDLEP